MFTYIHNIQQYPLLWAKQIAKPATIRAISTSYWITDGTNMWEIHMLQRNNPTNNRCNPSIYSATFSKSTGVLQAHFTYQRSFHLAQNFDDWRKHSQHKWIPVKQPLLDGKKTSNKHPIQTNIPSKIPSNKQTNKTNHPKIHWIFLSVWKLQSI